MGTISLSRSKTLVQPEQSSTPIGAGKSREDFALIAQKILKSITREFAAITGDRSLWTWSRSLEAMQDEHNGFYSSGCWPPVSSHGTEGIYHNHVGLPDNVGGDVADEVAVWDDPPGQIARNVTHQSWRRTSFWSA